MKFLHLSVFALILLTMACGKKDPPTITYPSDLPDGTILPPDTIVTPSYYFEHDHGLSEVHVWLGDAQGIYLPEFGDSAQFQYEHKTGGSGVGIAIIVPSVPPVSEAWLYGRAVSRKGVEANASLKLYFQ